MRLSAVRSLLSCCLLLAAPSMAGEAIDLDWLAGSWCSKHGEITSEETWLPERGGMLLAVSRTITKRGTEFEFIRIEIDSKGARYIAQPSGGAATSFELVDATTSSALFENRQHDFPKRIRYTRSGDMLTARIDGGDDASAREFAWERCESNAAD